MGNSSPVVRPHRGNLSRNRSKPANEPSTRNLPLIRGQRVNPYANRPPPKRPLPIPTQQPTSLPKQPTYQPKAPTPLLKPTTTPLPKPTTTPLQTTTPLPSLPVKSSPIALST